MTFFRRVSVPLLISFCLIPLLGYGAGRIARADSPATATPTLTPTVVIATEPPPTSTPVPLPTPTATATARAAPTREVKPTGHKPPSGSVSARSTPTPNSTPLKRAKHKKGKKPAGAKPKPTPVLALNAEDSISPVTCNGKGTADASHAFLLPPYHGWISLASYFDHDLPDFTEDGLVVIANGMLAQPDAIHQGKGFPAYWNSTLRQFIYYDGHNGYDFNLAYQPVYASAAGKVIFARYEYPDATDHGYGLMIMVEHRGGYVTLYGHLSKILVKNHQKVRAGQKIAISGNTGHSTGPHLHFTVFHNCTPTDPYGWSGSGADPLAQYQGESSVFLWKRLPLVTNPPPQWPGLRGLAAAGDPRILLLQLPGVSGGTNQFTRQLLSEARSVQHNLHADGVSVKLDLLRGAVDVSGPVKASTIYSYLDVASIAAPDTIEGDRQDVLQNLARASLYDKVRRFPVLDARGWVGYLLRWQGQALLLGRGVKGQQVSLRLGGHGGSWRRVQADPGTGAYALDLGHLTASQFAQLRKELAPSRKHSKIVVRTSPAGTASISAASPGEKSTGLPYTEIVLVVVLLALAAAAITWRLRLLRGSAKPVEPPSSGEAP